MPAKPSSHAPPALSAFTGASTGVVLNDVHSHLNPTRVHRVVPVSSAAEVQDAVRLAREVG